MLRFSRFSRVLLVVLIVPALLSTLVGSAPLPAQESPQAGAALPPRDPAQLVPPPAELVVHEAVFLLGAHSTVVVDAAAVSAHPVATRLARLLRAVSGQDVPIHLGDADDADFGAWVLRLRPDRSELGASGYRLRIEPEQLKLVAATPEGLGAGLATLRQLLPVEPRRPVRPAREILLPCLRLVDAPGVPLRGLVLEIGERAADDALLVHLVEQLGRHKLNRLRLTGDVEAASQELQDAAQREGVQLLVGEGGEADGGTTGGVELRLSAPTDWASATALPELGGAPALVEAVLALDEVPPGALDAWLWPRLLAVAEAAWNAPALPEAADFEERLLPHLLRLSAEGVAWFVPPPERLGTQGVFARTLDVTLANPAPLGRVHATTDGSAPTADSDIVDGVLSVDASATVRAAVFVGAGHGSEELSFDVRREAALPAATDPPRGLAAGMWWAAPPPRTMVVPTPFVALRFEGLLDAPLSGAYALQPLGEAVGRCVLTLGAGASARSFEWAAPGSPPVETVLEGGLHRVALDWWPEVAAAPPRLAWRPSGPEADAPAVLPWLAPPPPRDP